MAAEKPKRAKAGDQKHAGAARRTRRPGPRRSLNLSVCAEHYTRFKGLAVLLDREPGELFMDWVEAHASGLRFWMPAAGDGQARPPGPDAAAESGAA